MPYNLKPIPACYPFKIIILFVAGMLEQPASKTFVHNAMTIRQLCHGDAIISSHKHDKQSQSFGDVNVSPPKAPVGSRHCSMFCIEKCKHLKCSVSSKATTMEM